MRSGLKYTVAAVVCSAMTAGLASSAMAGPADVRPWRANEIERQTLKESMGHHEVKKDCKKHDGKKHHGKKHKKKVKAK